MYTFDQLIGAQMVDQATVDVIASGFAQLGIPFDTETMTPVGAQQSALGAAASYTENSAGKDGYAVGTQDIEVEEKTTGIEA